MIIIVLGGIGSGKSLTVVKELIQSKQYAFTNFKIKKYKNYHRIKYADIINRSEKIKDYTVNWEFWNVERKKNPNFSIFLDEIHNLIHSRRAMSKDNILMSKWISQIRKTLSDKPNNHIYLISQTMRKIDVDFRELAQIIIQCTKTEVMVKGKKQIWIKNTWYNGLEDWEMEKPTVTTAFYGNPYFKHYDTNEMVRFGEEYI